jgi:hypothetical protein
MNVTAGTVIKPGEYIRVTLDSVAGKTFKGFMVQAREGADSGATGSFLQGDSHKTLDCDSPKDTAVHTNNITKFKVDVIWVAPQEVPDEFRFFYTVVESYDQFWVMESSPDKLLGRPPGDVMYIKLHGSLMAFAWGVLVPVGIILALFYKVVWPKGHWFYIHILVMIVAILMVIAGVFMILLHSEWTWLDTTDLNISHQVLGIIALIAIIVNPLLGFFLILERCSLGTNWRKVYNWCHGSIGLFVAQGTALAAMLVGVHILRDHPLNFDPDTVHNAIYSVSAITATVVMTIALYNGYHVRYHKDHPKPDNFEDPPPSSDWWLRLMTGGVIIVLLLTPVTAAIYFIATI